MTILLLITSLLIRDVVSDHLLVSPYCAYIVPVGPKVFTIEISFPSIPVSRYPVMFIGSAGVGKTMLMIALGYEACRKCHDVRFTTAMDMVNHLRQAQLDGTLLHAMKTYTAPELLLVDKLGYPPVEHDGASLLSQVLADRYERASTAVTSNLAYAEWAQVFGNDAAMTSEPKFYKI